MSYGESWKSPWLDIGGGRSGYYDVGSGGLGNNENGDDYMTVILYYDTY